MMTGKTWESAGLVFLGDKFFDIVDTSNRVGNILESNDKPITGIRILSDESALVKSRHFDIWLKLVEEATVAPLKKNVPVMLEVNIALGDVPAGDWPLETTLAFVLKSLHKTFRADLIKWICEDVVLTSEEFDLATSELEELPRKPKPSLPRQRRQFPEIKNTNEVLQDRLSETGGIGNTYGGSGDFIYRLRQALKPQDEPAQESGEQIETPALRLSAWFVSFIVAILSLPVGAALIAYNLLKGENLRLTSQTAALTGTFVTFQVLGTTAQAMNALQNIFL